MHQHGLFVGSVVALLTLAGAEAVHADPSVRLGVNLGLSNPLVAYFGAVSGEVTMSRNVAVGLMASTNRHLYLSFTGIDEDDDATEDRVDPYVAAALPLSGTLRGTARLGGGYSRLGGHSAIDGTSGWNVDAGLGLEQRLGSSISLVAGMDLTRSQYTLDLSPSESSDDSFSVTLLQLHVGLIATL